MPLIKNARKVKFVDAKQPTFVYRQTQKPTARHKCGLSIIQM